LRSSRFAAASAAMIVALALPTLVVATDPPGEETVWLSGTFGKVVGTDPTSPATAAPDDRPLATWMRAEPLELVIDPRVDDETAVAISATTADGDESIELSIDEDRWVTGPDAPGLHTVVATVVRGAAEPRQYAWLLDVGDRPGSWETMLEMPAIQADLVAASGSVAGERGHGCLADFCQEVGYRPPAETLQPLTVAVGEPLTLELDDGSAIVHWEGRVEPYEADSETRFAGATFDGPVAEPVLSGLEPDVAGEWLLQVRADYDRERGWQWYLFRLNAE